MFLGKLFEAKSLKSRFSRFAIFFFSILTVVMVLSNLVSFASLSRYGRTSTRYEELSAFYDRVDSMGSSMINYIYTGNGQELKDYYGQSDKAESILAVLKSVGTEELNFRFTILGNMIRTYKERVEAFRQSASKDKDGAAYESFQRLKGLILDTYPFYSKILTSEMQREKRQMYVFWRTQLVITLGIFFLLLFFSVSFSLSGIKSITQPIDLMVKDIGRIRMGEFELGRFESECDEIRILTAAFNKMADDLNRYVVELKEMGEIERRLIEKENENLRISKLLTETRLAALQRQMNPHFLFNSLSTISKLAYIEGATKSSDLMVRTASVLRYSLDMGTRISNLALEIKCAEDYFEIQRKRVGDRVSFSLTAEGRYDEVRMPGMILQPLIENCILHGVADMVRDAVVHVEVARKDDRILITLEDNGIGISPARLEEIDQGCDDDRGSIGLSNVKNRLQLFFGGDFLFRIDSEINCGTLITIDIPALVEDASV